MKVMNCIAVLDIQARAFSMCRCGNVWRNTVVKWYDSRIIFLRPRFDSPHVPFPTPMPFFGSFERVDAVSCQTPLCPGLSTLVAGTRRPVGDQQLLQTAKIKSQEGRARETFEKMTKTLRKMT